MTQSSGPQSIPPRVVGVIAAKGGSGQSTIALEWAQALGHQGMRCLLIELAGGDLAWMVGAAPTHFTEDIAAGRATLGEAIVRIDGGVDLLATGNGWAIYGPSQDSQTTALATVLKECEYDAVIADFGHAAPESALTIWRACDEMALILEDDIASVARAYALLRRLNGQDFTDRLSLIFNRISSRSQADSLRQRFDQLTSRFLGRTWPLLGTIPDGPRRQRMDAMDAWIVAQAPVSTEEGAVSREQIIKPAIVADNKG